MKKLVLLLSFTLSYALIAKDEIKTQNMPTDEMLKQNTEIVKLASEELQKRLPQKVDEYTTLQRIEGKDTTLIYIFEINTGAKSDESIIKEDKSRMKKAIVSGICKSSKRFLDAQINITYVYKSAASKVKLFQFDVSREDCPKIEI